MQLMDGKAVAESVRARAAERVEDFRRRTGRAPGLATVLVGDDPASRVYVSGKHRVSREVGLASFDVVLPADGTQAQLEAEVDRLASDSDVDGMIVQLPLPAGLDAEAALARLPADKDVDGLTTLSQGRLATGAPGLRPATPSGVVELLRYYDVPLRGAHVVIVGRSNLVGKPLVHLLLAEDATVSICHSRTADLPAVTRTADVLVAAVGRPRLLGAEHVRDGAFVVDVGINRLPEGLVGDVDLEAIRGSARLATPVPGGVGPMTIAMLVENTVQAAEARLQRADA